MATPNRRPLSEADTKAIAESIVEQLKGPIAKKVTEAVIDEMFGEQPSAEDLARMSPQEFARAAGGTFDTAARVNRRSR